MEIMFKEDIYLLKIEEKWKVGKKKDLIQWIRDNFKEYEEEYEEEFKKKFG